PESASYGVRICHARRPSSATVRIQLDAFPAVTSLSSERNQRIRPTRAPRREEGRTRSCKAEDEYGGADGRGIGRVESEKKARERPRHGERRRDASDCAERHGRTEF